MSRKKADPTKTAKDGTRRGRPTKPGKGKPSRTGKKLALPLTPAQWLFIERYMARRNATRAYQDAYPNASYPTCNTEGSRLLADPRISQEIKALIEAETQRNLAEASRVTRELSAIAYSKLSDVIDINGLVIPLHMLPADVAMAVKKVKRREIIAPAKNPETGQMEEKVIGHTIELEMYDKLAALKMLGLDLGMFKEQQDTTSAEELLMWLQKARERSLQRQPTRVIEGEVVRDALPALPAGDD